MSQSVYSVCQYSPTEETDKPTPFVSSYLLKGLTIYIHISKNTVGVLLVHQFLATEGFEACMVIPHIPKDFRWRCSVVAY